MVVQIQELFLLKIYLKMSNFDNRHNIIARKCGCGNSKGDVSVQTNLTPIELDYDLELPTNFIQGLDGKSAYQYALDAGYIGTEEEFCQNLKKAGEGIDASDIEIDPAKLGITAEDITVGKDIVVTSPIGSYQVGDVISASHSLYDVMLMVFKENYSIPSYVMPEITGITLETSKGIEDIEIGDVVTLNMVCNYVQNDAGAPLRVEYYLNEYLLGTTSTPNVNFIKQHKFDQLHNVIKAIVYYTDGPIRTDAEGKAYEKGRIKAGNIESTLEVEAYNSFNTLFMGTSMEPLERESVTENVIKSLTKKIDNPQRGINTDYFLQVPNGSRTIIIAYPSRLGKIHDIRNLRTSINEIDAFEENLFQMSMYGENTNLTKFNVYFFTSETEMNNLAYKIMI